MKKLLLIGGGGHCHSVLDVIRLAGEYEPVGVLDKADKVGQSVSGVSVVGTDIDLAKHIDAVDDCLITVGQLGAPGIREKLFDQVVSLGGSLATIISPRAYVASSANLGAGTVVLHDALVNAHARVGENVILNTKSLVEHDAKVGSHVHIATGATVNGHAEIADRCFIGSRAVIFQECQIGENSIIGGGQVVRKNMPSDARPIDVG